jgi:hypothetical protein
MTLLNNLTTFHFCLNNKIFCFASLYENLENFQNWISTMEVGLAVRLSYINQDLYYNSGVQARVEMITAFLIFAESEN